MRMLQHDSATMFRFVLQGELTGDRVREFEHAWIAARSILGTKALVVEISGITNADVAGGEPRKLDALSFEIAVSPGTT